MYRNSKKLQVKLFVSNKKKVWWIRDIEFVFVELSCYIKKQKRNIQFRLKCFFKILKRWLARMWFYRIHTCTWNMETWINYIFNFAQKLQNIFFHFEFFSIVLYKWHLVLYQFAKSWWKIEFTCSHRSKKYDFDLNKCQAQSTCYFHSVTLIIKAIFTLK